MMVEPTATDRNDRSRRPHAPALKAMAGSASSLIGINKSRFSIYRADEVRVTSMLFDGGDWHWRLTDRAGTILADCGGYSTRSDCVAVVAALRSEATLASDAVA